MQCDLYELQKNESVIYCSVRRRVDIYYTHCHIAKTHNTSNERRGYRLHVCVFIVRQNTSLSVCF